MKRLWFGLVLLVFFLVLGIFITHTTAEYQNSIARGLSTAGEAALGGDWETAAACFGNAKAQWDRHRRLTASIADHEPMEEAENLFSQLEVYLRVRDPAAFSACCACLEVMMQAIGEAQAVNWWNLL